MLLFRDHLWRPGDGVGFNRRWPEVRLGVLAEVLSTGTDIGAGDLVIDL
jgi:hypothetical protein